MIASLPLFFVQDGQLSAAYHIQSLATQNRSAASTFSYSLLGFF